MKSPSMVKDLNEIDKKKDKDIFQIHDDEQDHYSVAKTVKASKNNNFEAVQDTDMNSPTKMETSIT